MVRKTVTIDDQLLIELKKEGILEHFKNFSELVSSSLKNTVETMKKENYRKQIEQMAQDPMVKDDIETIREDFKYADGETDAF